MTYEDRFYITRHTLFKLVVSGDFSELAWRDGAWVPITPNSLTDKIFKGEFDLDRISRQQAEDIISGKIQIADLRQD